MYLGLSAHTKEININGFTGQSNQGGPVFLLTNFRIKKTRGGPLKICGDFNESIRVRKVRIFFSYFTPI